jgi:hypothetical protein
MLFHGLSPPPFSPLNLLKFLPQVRKERREEGGAMEIVREVGEVHPHNPFLLFGEFIQC